MNIVYVDIDKNVIGRIPMYKLINTISNNLNSLPPNISNLSGLYIGVRIIDMNKIVSIQSDKIKQILNQIQGKTRFKFMDFDMIDSLQNIPLYKIKYYISIYHNKDKCKVLGDTNIKSISDQKIVFI